VTGHNKSCWYRTLSISNSIHEVVGYNLSSLRHVFLLNINCLLTKTLLFFAHFLQFWCHIFFLAHLKFATREYTNLCWIFVGCYQGIAMMEINFHELSIASKGQMQIIPWTWNGICYYYKLSELQRQNAWYTNSWMFESSEWICFFIFCFLELVWWRRVCVVNYWATSDRLMDQNFC
jgi:hypothetical protein